ncbi:MAG: restriction endonuclease subunit S [Cyanobacteriota bacterium]
MSVKAFLENFEVLTDTSTAGVELKQIIIQLAVQGKIDTQSLDDEPAYELLHRIQEERAKLIKAGMLKEIKLPKIALVDAPYLLPRGWEWVRLGFAVTFIGGSQPPKSKFIYQEREGYTRLIQIRDYKTDAFKTYIPNELANRPCSEDDVMIGRYGPPVFQILRGLEGTYNVALMKAEPIKSSFSKDYLFYLLQEPRIQKTVIAESERTAGQTGVRKELLNSFVVGLPPLAEQKRIVGKCDRLLMLCDEIEKRQQQRQESIVRMNESAVAQLFSSQNPNDFRQHWQRISNNFDLLYSIPETIPKLRQAILQLAVQGKLDRQDPNDEPATNLLKKLKFEKEQLLQEKRFLKSEKLAPITLEGIPYKIPPSWILTRIGIICGSIVPNRDKPKSFSGGFPWVTLSNFDKKGIRLLNNHSGIGLSQEEIIEFNARIIPNGSVVMSCVGRFGLVAVIEKDVVTNQQIHGFVIPNNLSPEYVAYVIKAHTDLLESSATSTTISYLNKTRCESIPFPLPPLAEQKRIVAKVDRLMSLCDGLEGKLKETRSHSEKLMEVAAREVLAV